MGNCVGSQAATAEEARSGKTVVPPQLGGAEAQAAPTQPVPVSKKSKRPKNTSKSLDLGQKISADSCKRTSASTDLSRGSLEDMYKMSQHPDVNRNEGISKSGPDDMSSMYMMHMDRVLDLPKDNSKAFRL
ncbi:hypothetical protein WJX74_003769 [Apatococcus lobatus]|uniref:Uncharacterized protein n=1 Tax=Apatococcus lobatus TaxID=904363 RepID=A0AAW1RD30_9CHLO